MPKRKFTRDAVGSSSTQSSAKKSRGGSGRPQPMHWRRRSAATRLQALFRGRKERKRWRKRVKRFRKYGVKNWSKKAFVSKGRIARNRKRALQILAEKAAAKMIKQKGLSVVNKKKLATLPGVVTKHLYRKYCTMGTDPSTLWLGNEGQLVIDPTGSQGEPFIDKISHAPFYHFEWINFVSPGNFSRFVEVKALTNDPNGIDSEAYSPQTFPNTLAGMGVSNRGIPPGASGGATEALEGLPDMFYYDNGMDPHQDLARHFGYNEKKIDILPKIFHDKQLEGVIDKSHDELTTIDKYIDEWARICPSRSTDQIKIKNFYIKFDFDTKFYGDEGTRENVIVAGDNTYSDLDAITRRQFFPPGVSTVADTRVTSSLINGTGTITGGGQAPDDIVDTKPKMGKRVLVTMNNRVPNMFAKVRVIIGKRKVFGKTPDERVCLHNVLKTDHPSMYARGISDEEYLSDLFSRQNIRDKKKTYGTTHRNIDEDEYADITIVKDEVITLGRGHSVKTFNVFKNTVLTYPSTEQNNGLIVDPIDEIPQGIPGPGQGNFNLFGYQNFQNAEITSDHDVDKLKIPLENDMFMYVLNFTKGASVRWRLTTKMSYHSC